MHPIRTLGALVILLAVLAACGGEGAKPTPTQAPATATVTLAAAATATSVATTTATPVREPTATVTIPPTATPAPTPTPSPSPLPTATPDPVVYDDIILGDLYTDPYHGPTGPLYAVDADGSDLHPISSAPDGAYEFWPAVSPDGTRVVFVRSGGGEGAVYVVDIATGAEQKLVDGRAGASWSPDGRRLLLLWQEHSSGLACCGQTYEEVDPPKIAVVNPDGSDLRVLYDSAVDAAAGGRIDWRLVWSPDGTRVLFVRHVQPAEGMYDTILTVVNVDGSGLHDIDTGPITPYGAFQWSPDGSTIVFLGHDGQFPGPGLFSVMPDGSRLNRLTTPDVEVGDFAYAPDGSTITFVGTRVNPKPAEYRQSVNLIAPDGSGMRQLTPSNLLVGQFAYSPDGSKIAIRTYDNGTLTIVNADGTPLLTPDTGSLFWGMSWSPDSTRLVYLTNPDRAWNELRVVDTRTGAVTPALALIRNGEGVVQPVWRPTGE